MSHIHLVHGRACYKVGNRFFAVPKVLDKASEIATLHEIRGPAWNKHDRTPKTGQTVQGYRARRR